MRSLTIAIAVAVAVAFVCASGASADVAGATAPSRAVEACPVHCPTGSVLRGDACLAKRCLAVMCPKFVKTCPAGTHLGRRSLADCCNNACVKDCTRPPPPPG
jgi:hypothetical protein